MSTQMNMLQMKEQQQKNLNKTLMRQKQFIRQSVQSNSNGFLMELGNIICEHSENFQEMVKDRGAWHAGVHGVTKSPT